MWSILVQLIEHRCRNAEDTEALAEPLIAIYGALTHCKLVYDRLEAGNADDLSSAPLDEREWDAALAMQSMIATLHNVQPIMHLFHGPDARDLALHARRPRAFENGDHPEDKLRREVEAMRQLLAIETTDMAIDITSLLAFSEARSRLAGLIADHYTMDRLFSADRR